MKTITLILMMAVLAVPAMLAGQTPDERIGAALDRAEDTGIPVSLLESKLAEGRAKGVPLETIAGAVERRLDGLTRAREAMQRTVPDGVDAAQLGVGADALESGVGEEVLAELAGETVGDQRAVAVAALTHLVGQGIVPDQALDRVRDALARGPGALANLPGFAGPPAGVPDAGNRPEGGVEAGPPASVPAPGQGGPPNRPGPGGPPDGLPGGPPGAG